MNLKEEGRGSYVTGNEYQKLAMRTCVSPVPWHNEAVMNHGVFGLCAEAGEVASIFQKYYQGHGHPLNKEEHLKKELGDCLWMIAEICTGFGFDMDDVMETNIQKLRERYPDGFDPDKSLHRKDGDI